MHPALAIALIVAAFIVGWLMRDSTVPVPTGNSPDGTYPKNEGG